MIQKATYWLLLFSCGFLTKAEAQDPQFSQFFNVPVYTNPALTGQTLQWKFSLSTRNQWLSTTGPYVSNALTAEYNMLNRQGAVGLQFLKDRAGSANLSHVQLGGLYAYKPRLSRNLSLSLGAKYSLNQRYYDQSSFQWASDITGTDDNLVTQDLLDRVTYFDVAAGVALYARNWWVGFSIDHINTPNYAFGVTRSQLDMKFSRHALYQFTTVTSRKGQVLESMVIAANWKAQNKWDQLELGGFYNTKGLSFGMFYRSFFFQQTVPNNFNQDAIYLLLGYRWKKLGANYSYDMTISKLGSSSGGSHEISLIAEAPFEPKRRLRSQKKQKCPEC